MHALIIDDNSRNTSVLARLLAEQNVSSTQFNNPSQLDGALRQIDPVDLIFLDLEMPGLDGYEVLAKLKADGRFAHLPIIACTVHVSEINAAYQRGFHSFIGKPLDPDKFPGQLTRIMQGEPVWEMI